MQKEHLIDAMSFARSVIKTLIVLSAIFAPGFAGQCSEFPSPDGRFSVRVVTQESTGTSEGAILILSKDGHVVLRQPTSGYILNALWSPDGRYVAINNRRGNSGDYVWVIATRSHLVLKRPDDGLFSHALGEIRKICSECNDASFDRNLTLAKAWKSSNELEIETRSRFYQTALIIRQAVYGFRKNKATLITDKVTRHPSDWQPEEH